MDWSTVLMLVVIFVATLIRSAFGFGEALIAVPLLALFMPVEAAVPLAALISITVAALAVVQDWEHIQFRSAGWLVFSSLFGIPLGLWLLKAVAEHVVKAILALVILTFSCYCLLSRRPFTLQDDRRAWLFGVAAGVLGGAYGMNGPPLAVYGTLRRWSAEHFRATLQGYFLLASIAVMGGYTVAGLWTLAVSRSYLLCLPVVLAAIVLGRAVHRRLKGPRFLIYVHVGLLGIGTTLLLQSLWR